MKEKIINDIASNLIGELMQYGFRPDKRISIFNNGPEAKIKGIFKSGRRRIEITLMLDNTPEQKTVQIDLEQIGQTHDSQNSLAISEANENDKASGIKNMAIEAIATGLRYRLRESF